MFHERFRDRLAALVRAQLAFLGEVVDARIRIGGPALRLSASAAQAIGMALHELATNASKYGALSNDRGRIEIDWAVDKPPGRFCLSWTESGGPPVKVPARQGFGSVVIEDMPKMQLDAAIDIDFAPSGLKWRLDCSAENVMAAEKSIQSEISKKDIVRKD